MGISRQRVAQKIIDYLHHRITLSDLIDWAESVMMEGDFDERDRELLRDIVSRIGLADVQNFSITWEDWENFLSGLGYRVSVTVFEAPAMADSH